MHKNFSMKIDHKRIFAYGENKNKHISFVRLFTIFRGEKFIIRLLWEVKCGGTKIIMRQAPSRLF